MVVHGRVGSIGRHHGGDDAASDGQDICVGVSTAGLKHARTGHERTGTDEERIVVGVNAPMVLDLGGQGRHHDINEGINVFGHRLISRDEGDSNSGEGAPVGACAVVVSQFFVCAEGLVLLAHVFHSFVNSFIIGDLYTVHPQFISSPSGVKLRTK